MLAAALLVGAAAPASAKVFASKQEALAAAFPGAERVESRTYVLTDAQVEAVEQIARSAVESKLVTVYEGLREGRSLGYAFIDVHTVRTLPEAFLVVVGPGGEVRSLRVLAFYEPQEYLPTERWLSQFDARQLSDELQLRRGIHGIAGATLSARAVTGGVRRALAFYEVLVQNGTQNGTQNGKP